ncbi:MAG: 6-hydroxymethylpterin diphosphokinase MptE-like protein [Sulfolobales archaeon]
MRTRYNIFKVYMIYQDVLKNLTGVDLDREWDASLAACLVSRSLDVREPTMVLEELERLASKRKALVIGAGPGIESATLDLIIEKYDTIVCADGACMSIPNRSCRDHILCIYAGDLDGGLESLIRILRSGGYGFIQFHGDNYSKISSLMYYIRNYRDRILITVQTPPLCNLTTIIPGFTDGDRAYMIAKVLLKIKEIDTLGMDLDSPYSSMYSKPWLSGRSLVSLQKAEKLRWAKRIIYQLSLPIYIDSSSTPELESI